jgi:hypothetical protein
MILVVLTAFTFTTPFSFAATSTTLSSEYIILTLMHRRKTYSGCSCSSLLVALPGIELVYPGLTRTGITFRRRRI